MIGGRRATVTICCGWVMGRVVLVCVGVLGLSCQMGQWGGECPCRADAVGVFLAGFRQAVLDHDEGLLLEAYIDPHYRSEQLDGLLGGDRRQFFDELFGLGRNRFDEIVAMEFVSDDVHFQPLNGRANSNVQVASCPVVLTYENGVRIEDCIFVFRYRHGERRYTIEGPRG